MTGVQTCALPISGEKLIFLLRKLAFENILIIICLWHSKLPGTLGPVIYHYIIDEAKELLKIWFQKEFKEDDEISQLDSGKSTFRTVRIGQGIITRYNSTAEFAGQCFITQKQRKLFGDFRPNMFQSINTSPREDISVFKEIPKISSNYKFISR